MCGSTGTSATQDTIEHGAIEENYRGTPRTVTQLLSATMSNPSPPLFRQMQRKVFRITLVYSKFEMQLGNFSIGLSVKDLGVSKAFYETLGFAMVMGDEKQGWIILQNGDATIGLFQGMFEKNTLTFNPGWDKNAKELKTFTDIRDIQKKLKQSGVTLLQEANEGTEPTSFIIVDPDGNPIFVDQHVSKSD
jgi:predicted lactoylglutathione lyase